MSISTIFIYIVSSIVLYCILNWITKKDGDFYLNAIIITQIYIVVLSGILGTINSRMVENIFLVPILELVLRIFITNYICEMPFWDDNNIIWQYLISILGCYFLNTLLINQVDSMFPSQETVKTIIWILIVIYMFMLIKSDYNKKIINNTKKISKDKNRDYIITRYAQLKNKYHNIVKMGGVNLVPILYTIMIYENYKRPLFLRNVDKIRYKWDNKRRKYGIMQVMSNYPISDEKSIRLVIKKLDKIYNSSKKMNKDLGEIIRKYYKDNVDYLKIKEIYEVIINFEAL